MVTIQRANFIRTEQGPFTKAGGNTGAGTEPSRAF